MFSPSLVSMLLHSVWTDLSPQPGTWQLLTAVAVDKDLQRLLGLFSDRSLPMPSVPIVGQSELVLALGRHAQILQEVTHGPGLGNVFGRVPVDVLVKQFHASYAQPSASDYLDLGTSLREAQQFHPTGLQNCIAWLSNHPLNPAAPTRITVAIIDRGVDLPAGQLPETLGGRLVHVMNHVDFSDHAALVLTELVGRLASSNLLGTCDLVCALIKPPVRPIGRACFEHANIVELEQAIKELSDYISDPGRRSAALPLVTNVSMGAHIGPHDGHSPLEDLIDRLLPFNLQRYLVCSAGNDGLAGLAARCELRNGARDFMRIQTTSDGCEDILVELWWEEPLHSTMEITARVYDKHKTRIGSPIFIDTNTAGPLITGSRMALANAGFQSVVCESLFHARCGGDYSCIAFAMSARQAADLASLTIDIELRCSDHSNVLVNAWIVIADNDGARFLGGVGGSTITVPATFEQALSVAGVEDVPHANPALRAQPWLDSSRGPAAHYGVSQSVNVLPKLAHRVDGSIDGFGTSFASPRAAGDAVECVLRDAATSQYPLQVKKYVDVDELAKSIVARHGTTTPNGILITERVGYGGIV